ncbi:MAG: DNA recombination protein RmuC [bacterium]|nr:DNA recombination protein RmuC [bacterium]
MSNIVLMAVILLVLTNAVALFIFARKFGEKKDGGEGEGMKLLLTQLHEFSRTVDQKMSETNKMMNESVRNQFSESAKLIREVTQGLTKLDETNKQVVSFADQLQSLQDILKNPKQRGVLGEYYLETLLKNVLPPGSYQMQYTFKDGTIVDAVVFVKDKIIPIDSKFSLENYNRIVEEKNPVEKEKLEKLFVSDLKNRIAETSKYIQPGQGTMDFAFMFIPHEAIYYDLIVNKIGALKEDSETLIQRAASKYHVLIVSPTSFLAYLQTVLQGLNALHIEEKAVEIIKRVEELGRHLKSYEEYYAKLGNSLSTTINHYNSGYKELGKVDKDVLRITGTGIGLEPLTLEKPSVE